MQKQASPEPALMTGKEAAEHLGISEKHLYNLAKRGLIPRVVLGSRAIRYRRSDLEALIAQMTVREESPPNKLPRPRPSPNPEWN